MGINFSNVSNVPVTGPNGDRGLGALIARGNPGEGLSQLPLQSGRLRLNFSPLGEERRSVVTGIKREGEIEFALLTTQSECGAESSGFTDRYQFRKTTLFSAFDDNGNPVFFIKNGNHAVALGRSKSLVLTRLKATLAPNYVGSQRWNSETENRLPQNIAYHPLDRSLLEKLINASSALRPDIVRSGGCGMEYEP